MNRHFKQPPLATIDRETVVQPAAPPSPQAKVCCPKRQLASGSGPHLTKETQVLLLSRLRAAALILLLGFGVFLVRHIVVALTGEPLSPVLLGLHVLNVLVLGVCALPLCRSCTVSLRKLRVAELIIFGLPT